MIPPGVITWKGKVDKVAIVWRDKGYKWAVITINYEGFNWGVSPSV